MKPGELVYHTCDCVRRSDHMHPRPHRCNDRAVASVREEGGVRYWVCEAHLKMWRLGHPHSHAQINMLDSGKRGI